MNLTSPLKRREFLKQHYGDLSAASITPWERVTKTIAGERADRVPFDFWAVPEIYQRLQTYLGVDSNLEVEELLGTDCRKLAPDYIGPAPIEKEDNSYVDTWGTHRRQVENSYGGIYEEYASFPLAGAESPADIYNWKGWAKAKHWDYSTLAAKARTINEKTRYHLRFELGGIFELSWGLYGLQDFLMDLIEDPAIPCAIMDCFTELFINMAERALEVAGDKIDLVYTYDDIGMQNNLIISKKMWEEYILPRHQKLNSFLKKYPVKIMYHSCGAIYSLIPDFINKMNIDILNPLQPQAAGMDMKEIKDNFGDKLAFHGGIDLQKTMPRGSVTEVQEEVQKRCQVLGRRGGYICAPAHHIQADTPLENIIALYTTAREY